MIKTYKILYEEKYLKQIKKIPKTYQKKVREKVKILAENPFPDGHIKLLSSEKLYRVRIGPYRVIYTVKNENLIILIMTLGHRKDVYKMI
jgi:mRNA interferase RelE/StbE